jgi:hypothetical protein
LKLRFIFFTIAKRSDLPVVRPHCVTWKTLVPSNRKRFNHDWDRNSVRAAIDVRRNPPASRNGERWFSPDSNPVRGKNAH